ncbi:unnamed protein product [Acanthoscelides obtectus]|uniref:Transcription factor Dp-1 n=3 Tax=Bruchini TaxID=256835 RepID=A0A9P0PA54_ACAOB|nr:unnamed protein product [Acanthoscelides obtectus]CAK1630656.1 Transcription factor Dp-1 [Acanthoscelides obtectus]
MTQQTNTTNWVIQGSNGQPQMIKLVQSGGKSGIMTTTTVAGQPVKIFKPPTNTPDSSQMYTTGTTAQVLRTIGTPKIVTKTVPIHVGNIARNTKTIRLTPSQMQNIKFVTPNQKVPVQQTCTTSTATTSVPIVPQQASPKNASPPILTRKRPDTTEMDYAPESKRSRKPEKLGKGLRHFSMKVCEKVKQKGTTTYNEVADELVGEFTSASSNNSLADQYDQKNIRRRVYDALNVLMAMNIISKEKKEIKWIGLPTNSLQECSQLEKEMQKKISVIKQKERQLDDLILNQIAFKNLAQRNREMERLHGPPPPNSYIQLPFIVVNTNKKTIINCSISNDKMEYLFQFNDKFEINDDVEILKAIGMLSGLDKGECTSEDLERLKTLIPESLWPYLHKIASGQSTLETILEVAKAGNTSIITADDYVEATLDEENSRQSSSFDAMSPSAVEYSDEDVDSDMSSDTELN